MARSVRIQSAEQVALARRAGHLAAEVLDMIGPHVVPGVSTATLDRICHDHIVNVQQAVPANLGYHGYPKTILTSVNQVVCHGIPSEGKILKKGDIVNIDVAVNKDGWFGDTSRMFFVGEPGTLAHRVSQHNGHTGRREGDQGIGAEQPQPVFRYRDEAGRGEDAQARGQEEHARPADRERHRQPFQRTRDRLAAPGQAVAIGLEAGSEGHGFSGPCRESRSHVANHGNRMGPNSRPKSNAAEVR